jgi:hypothetical protein
MSFVSQDPCPPRRKRRIIWRLSHSEMLMWAVSAMITTACWCNSIVRMSSRKFFIQMFIVRYRWTACIQTRKDYGVTTCGRKLSIGFRTLGGKHWSNSMKSTYWHYNTCYCWFTALASMPFHDGLMWHIFRLSSQWISLMVQFSGICQRFKLTCTFSMILGTNTNLDDYIRGTGYPHFIPL